MNAPHKRVLIVVSVFGRGLTDLLANMARTLHERGDVDILAVSGEEEQSPGLRQDLSARGVRLEVLRGLDTHRRFMGLARQITQVIDEFLPDVVSVHTNWQLALFAYVRIRTGRSFKIAYTIHGYRHNHWFMSFAARLAIGLSLKAFADAVITPSSFLWRKFWMVRGKSRVIFLGVENRFFEWSPPPSAGSPVGMVFPAEFRKGKNQALLIRVLADYLAGHRGTQLVLYLPGNGPLRKDCEALARDSGVAGHVVFPGQLSKSEMLEMYRRCLIAVVPSNVETFGSCIAEPFVLGRVVISRRTGVALDIIRGGENGFLFRTRRDLSRLLEGLVGDAERCRKVAQAARASGECFRWDKVCEELEELFAEM